MYAIIETGGKQYRVQKGDVIDIELLKDYKEGTIEFKNVLFINNGSTALIGNPYLAKGVVRGKFLEEVRGPKVIAFKYKQRKNIRRKVGHRQDYLRVEITEIAG